MVNNLNSVLFGNYDFLHEMNFGDYWISKYKITKMQLESFLNFIFVLFIGASVVQFIFNIAPFEFLVVELITFFICLRTFNFAVQLQFRKYKTKVDIVGYFVLNELVIILKTSKSLKDAVCFIIKGEYHIFSDIFREALVNCHFGSSLNESLRTQFVKATSGELRRLFLNILDTWENGNNLAQLSNNLILSHLSEYITEETDKVDVLGSLFSGLIFLSPPVILTFLLLSGLLNYSLGFLLVIMMILGSFLFRPDQQLSVFSHQSYLLPFTDQKTTEFLMILAEYLTNGLSFDNSLNKALNIYLENFNEKSFSLKKESIVSHRLGLFDKVSLNHDFLKQLFLPRTIQILFLIEKFSTINSRLAGSMLLTITDELNQLSSLLRIGMARVKAVVFQNKIIQLFSIISLGFITGASQLFLVVSNSLQMSYTTKLLNQNYDPLLILFGVVMSILPLYNMNKGSFNIKILFSSAFVFRFSKFTIFLVVFFFTKNFLSMSF